jgi:GT2 family glycosyltransferase
LILLGDLVSLLGRREPIPPPEQAPIQAGPASLIIVTWDGKELLQQYLPSVVEAVQFDGGEHEIIVVDNGSSDGTIEYLLQNFPMVRILPLEKNYGFSEGNNRGVREAKNEVVILLNNDMQVQRDFIRPLLEGFQDPTVFAVSCQVFFQDRTRRREETGKTRARWERGFFAPFHDEVLETDGLAQPIPILWGGGGSCAYRRSRFLELGGFDALFYPFYLEDTDLSYQAWKRGWETVFAPGSVVIHRHRGTTQRKFSADYVKGAIRKNQYLFIWKNITDSRWTWEHFFFLPWNLLRFMHQTSPHFEWKALRWAIGQLPACLQARSRTRALSRQSDHEIFRRTGLQVPREGTTTLDFNLRDFGEQLGPGWHLREFNDSGGYRWTGLRSAFFLFPEKGENILEVRGFIPELRPFHRPFLHLQLFQEKKRFFETRIAHSGPLVLKVPLVGIQVEDGHPLLFELRLNATFSPARSGTGTDTRELGIVITSLRLI